MVGGLCGVDSVPRHHFSPRLNPSYPIRHCPSTNCRTRRSAADDAPKTGSMLRPTAYRPWWPCSGSAFTPGGVKLHSTPRHYFFSQRY